MKNYIIIVDDGVSGKNWWTRNTTMDGFETAEDAYSYAEAHVNGKYKIVQEVDYGSNNNNS